MTKNTNLDGCFDTNQEGLNYFGKILKLEREAKIKGTPAECTTPCRYRDDCHFDLNKIECAKWYKENEV